MKINRLFYRALYFVFVAVICLSTLEMASRYIWKIKYNQWLEAQLHGYDHVDYDKSIIVPNQNTVMTSGEYIKLLKHHNKILSLTEYKDFLQHSKIKNQTVIFTINRYGFKGPEITIPKPPSVFRILALGVMLWITILIPGLWRKN